MGRVPGTVLTWINGGLRRVQTVAVVMALTLAIFLTPMALAQFVPRGFQPPPVYMGPTAGDMIGYRFAVLFVGAFLGFAIGAFFSPALKEFRTLIGIGLVIAVVLFTLFGPFPIADIFSLLAAAFLFVVALALGLRLGAAAAAADAARQRPTSFGSAKWADLEHLQQHGLLGDGGFLLGEFPERGHRYSMRYEGARHLLTVAPTRSGKGVSSIIPNLLTYEGAALVVDPKGENALVTAYRRGPGSAADKIAGMGQKVLLVDPWDIAASSLKMPRARFNPLDWISADDVDAAENAFLLADALVPVQGEGEARFWDEEAKALLTGLILYVATAPEERDRRHLGRVRDLLVQTEDDLKDTLTAMFNHPNAVVSTTAARTASKDPKLRSSVLATAHSHTHFLDSPRIRDSLAQSDFRFEDLKTTKMTVYLILPADRLRTFDRWLRLLIQQAITVNARNIDRKPEKPILFLLDEMASLGRLPSLEQAFSLMAGFGMQLWGIVQDLSQLARIYGETGWQTFISNSGVIQYFGSRDKMTAEYFSTLCGVTTVEVRNFSWAVGKVLGYSSSSTSGSGGFSSTSGESTSTSHTSTSGINEAQRHLAYPDELMVLKGHEQILFVENLDPIAGQKIVWHADDALKQQGVNLHAPVSAAVPQAQAA